VHVSQSPRSTSGLDCRPSRSSGLADAAGARARERVRAAILTRALSFLAGVSLEPRAGLTCRRPAPSGSRAGMRSAGATISSRASGWTAALFGSSPWTVRCAAAAETLAVARGRGRAGLRRTPRGWRHARRSAEDESSFAAPRRVPPARRAFRAAGAYDVQGELAEQGVAVHARAGADAGCQHCACQRESRAGRLRTSPGARFAVIRSRKSSRVRSPRGPARAASPRPPSQPDDREAGNPARVDLDGYVTCLQTIDRERCVPRKHRVESSLRLFVGEAS